jgi:hypothetical protein
VANTATSAGLAASRDPEGCSRHAKKIRVVVTVKINPAAIILAVMTLIRVLT